MLHEQPCSHHEYITSTGVGYHAHGSVVAVAGGPSRVVAASVAVVVIVVAVVDDDAYGRRTNSGSYDWRTSTSCSARSACQP